MRHVPLPPTLAVLLLASAVPGSAPAQTRPAAVTDSAIGAGAVLYSGKGNCAACHGDAGQGTDEGEALTSGRWVRGDGSFDYLLSIIRHSGIGARGRAGDPAPMRGPSLLEPEEIRAVAAYVWTISRGRSAPPTR